MRFGCVMELCQFQNDGKRVLVIQWHAVLAWLVRIGKCNNSMGSARNTSWMGSWLSNLGAAFVCTTSTTHYSKQLLRTMRLDNPLRSNDLWVYSVRYSGILDDDFACLDTTMDLFARTRELARNMRAPAGPGVPTCHR